MRIISRRRLVEFWEVHPDAEQPLRAWYTETKKASWNSPAEIKAIYRSVSNSPITGLYSTSKAIPTG